MNDPDARLLAVFCSFFSFLTLGPLGSGILCRLRISALIMLMAMSLLGCGGGLSGGAGSFLPLLFGLANEQSLLILAGCRSRRSSCSWRCRCSGPAAASQAAPAPSAEAPPPRRLPKTPPSSSRPQRCGPCECGSFAAASRHMPGTASAPAVSQVAHATVRPVSGCKLQRPPQVKTHVIYMITKIEIQKLKNKKIEYNNVIYAWTELSLRVHAGGGAGHRSGGAGLHTLLAAAIHNNIFLRQSRWRACAWCRWHSPSCCTRCFDSEEFPRTQVAGL